MPATTALFGNTARAANKNLVEFRAGKMQLKGTTVSPDRRKGLVYLYQTDDSLMHFCWKDRATGTVEEDLIIFPEDCEYQRITQCSTGRVYALKFRSTSRRLFFWLQEPKNDKDEENCRKINDLLNNPPTPGSHSTPSRGGSGASAASMLSGELRDSELQNILGNISQQQLMQILGNNVPNIGNLVVPSSGSKSSGSSTSTTTTTPSSATVPSSGSTTASASGSSGGSSKPGPIQLSDLQTILSGMMGKEGASTSSSQPKESVDLSLGMTAEALQPILSDPEFVEQLTPFLPATGETMPTAEQLRGTVTSPQFQQAVSLFSSVLQTGELGPLVQQFGLGDEAVAAATSADLEAFVKALGKKKDDKDKSDKKEDKEDENMAVD